MSDTPQQRSDDAEEDLGTTPAAPQTRTDGEPDGEEGPPASTEGGDRDQLQPPVTRDEVERRQLDDD